MVIGGELPEGVGKDGFTWRKRVSDPLVSADTKIAAAIAPLEEALAEARAQLAEHDTQLNALADRSVEIVDALAAVDTRPVERPPLFGLRIRR